MFGISLRVSSKATEKNGVDLKKVNIWTRYRNIGN